MDEITRANDALRLALTSGLIDDQVVDKAAWVDEQLKQYRTVVGKGAVAIRKGAENMELHDETIVAIAKNVAAGRCTNAVFAKSIYHAAITKRANEIRREGRTDAQAYVDCVTDDEIGRTLFKAMRVADGPDHELAPAEQPKAPELGPASAQMQALADDHLKAHPELAERRGVKDGGKAAAYAAAYAHPNNHDLRERVKAEHLAALTRSAA